MNNRITAILSKLSELVETTKQKQDALTSGDFIKIVNNVISADMPFAVIEEASINVFELETGIYFCPNTELIMGNTATERLTPFGGVILLRCLEDDINFFSAIATDGIYFIDSNTTNWLKAYSPTYNEVAEMIPTAMTTEDVEDAIDEGESITELLEEEIDNGTY